MFSRFWYFTYMEGSGMCRVEASFIQILNTNYYTITAFFNFYNLNRITRICLLLIKNCYNNIIIKINVCINMWKTTIERSTFYYF